MDTTTSGIYQDQYHAAHFKAGNMVDQWIDVGFGLSHDQTEAWNYLEFPTATADYIEANGSPMTLQVGLWGMDMTELNYACYESFYTDYNTSFYEGFCQYPMIAPYYDGFGMGAYLTTPAGSTQELTAKENAAAYSTQYNADLLNRWCPTNELCWGF